MICMAVNLSRLKELFWIVFLDVSLISTSDETCMHNIGNIGKNEVIYMQNMILIIFVGLNQSQIK